MSYYKKAALDNSAVFPESLVDRPIGPVILAVAMLESPLELPHVLLLDLSLAIVVAASASAMHQPIGPWPSVQAVRPSLLARAYYAVALEGSLEVAGGGGEEEFSEAVLEVVFEVAYELGAVGKALLAQPFLFAVGPLAFVVTRTRGLVVLAVAVGLVSQPLSFVIAAVAIQHYA